MRRQTGKNSPWDFVSVALSLPFRFDLTSRMSFALSSSAFGVIFLVEGSRDFFSDASNVLLLDFSVGISTTMSSTTEGSLLLGFVVLFGGAFAFSGVIHMSVRLMF